LPIGNEQMEKIVRLKLLADIFGVRPETGEQVVGAGQGLDLKGQGGGESVMAKCGGNGPVHKVYVVDFVDQVFPAVSFG
jgi:hypothetical protein